MPEQFNTCRGCGCETALDDLCRSCDNEQAAETEWAGGDE